jgi:hypothetical protein
MVIPASWHSQLAAILLCSFRDEITDCGQFGSLSITNGLQMIAGNTTAPDNGKSDLPII